MDRVIAYIDGYNLYYGLREQGWKRYYWLNLQKLAGQFLRQVPPAIGRPDQMN